MLANKMYTQYVILYVLRSYDRQKHCILEHGYLR